MLIKALSFLLSFCHFRLSEAFYPLNISRLFFNNILIRVSPKSRSVSGNYLERAFITLISQIIQLFNEYIDSIRYFSSVDVSYTPTGGRCNFPQQSSQCEIRSYVILLQPVAICAATFIGQKTDLIFSYFQIAG